MSVERATLPDGLLAQHDHVALLVARLRRACSAGVPWADSAKLVNELLADVEAHFASEEEAMVRASYPKHEDHKAMHATFVRRLKVLRAECERGETELLGPLTDLLERWFQEHERTADRDVLVFLGLLAS